MLGPPKKRRALCGSALRKLRLQTAYHITAFLAKVFEKPFWFFEQKRTSLLDQIDNERADE
jgi:hypothetical protein